MTNNAAVGRESRECIRELLPPSSSAGASLWQKSLLYPETTDLSPAEHAQLADAYELACDKLVDKYGYTDACSRS